MNISFKALTFSIFIAFFLNACSSKETVLNIPLEQNASLPVTKYVENNNSLSLFLTFSGGGTRAASFAYGVLKGLKKKNLLEKVNVISSVSGGSFTSAYYGLYGNKIFDDFEEKFLKKPVQTSLLDIILNPFNWFSYSLSNRSDYVASYYEKEIFGKKYFKDLRKKPKIIINATDISTGNAFSFSQENFARICSNLDEYPIGKAVVASSAVPGIFSPIVLKNYANCPKKTYKNSKIQTLFTHNNEQTKNLQRYNDKEKYPFLHLVDGGITDNLGLRSLFHIISETDNDFVQIMKTYGIPNTDKIAIIVVNAADSLNPNIPLKKENPSIKETLETTSTIQLTRYNADTLDMLHYYALQWQKQISTYRKKLNIANKKELKFYLIELNFNQLPHKKAKLFSRTQTSLELPPQRVDELIKAGEELLLKSPKFQKLLEDLKKNKLSQNMQ